MFAQQRVQLRRRWYASRDRTSAADIADIERLLVRQARRLQEIGA
jgi:hypothetical protein